MSVPIALSSVTGAAARAGSAVKGPLCAAALSLILAACAGSDAVTEAMRGYQPCHPADSQGEAARCERGHNVLMAMATGGEIAPEEFVEEKVLEEQRGGFITAGGLRLDFGFEFQTIINGTPQLTSILSYNDILSGKGGIPNLNSITLTSGDRATQIIHSGGPTGIGATILNSQDGLNITNVSTLAIDIINLNRVHRGGRALGNGRRMPLELQHAIIHGLKQ